MRIAGIAVIITLLISAVILINRQESNATPASPTFTGSQLTSQNPDAPLTEVLVENLDTPWDIAFLPDGDMIFSERPGTVRALQTDGTLHQLADIEQVQEIGEGGLLGLAIDPDFTDNNFIYLYYTYSNSDDNTLNRVVRMTYTGESLQNEEIVVDAIPGASNHNGGQIEFGPDGNLYITTGDAQEPSQSQNTETFAGKVLRVVNGDAVVFSYGHRNPQGLAWDTNGNLWATEHGRSGVQSGYDEVNLIREDANYGWPDYEGDETANGIQIAARHSGATTTWAPAGVAVINDTLYFAGLRGNALYSADINGESISEVIEHFKSEYGRIRAVTAGPDGMLYISTSNRDGRGNPDATDDKIIRINPQRL